MRITLPYNYTEEVVPPRCRVPRRVQQSATIKLTLNEVPSDAAPVAIMEHEDDCDPVAYRWWKNRLYRRCFFQRVSRGELETQTLSQFAGDPYPYSLNLTDNSRYDGYNSKPEQRCNYMSWARSLIFVDGERWEQASEPRYVIMTFGLGHNHGLAWGTSLSTDSCYNSNIGRSRYFRIDQYAAALAKTERIALARGDTKALPVEDQHPTRYTVLIPEAIRLQPPKEHGNGDPFMNHCESLIQASSHSAVSGLLLTKEAMDLNA